MSKIISGRDISNELLKELKAKTLKLNKKPHLCVLQVGDLPESRSYINRKKIIAEQCGLKFTHIQLKNNCSFDELNAKIDELNNSKEVTSYIVQMPLDATEISPASYSDILDRIDPKKDADGLSLINQGRLFTQKSSFSNWTSPLPATPYGILKLLAHQNIELESKNVCVIGQSRLVGRPVATLLSLEKATVTLCNSKTTDLKAHTKNADVLIVAAGKKHLITPEHIKNGCVIIDVGIHVLKNGKLTGDVSHDCYSKASAYTPVPGGVGPMTVVSLIENTINIASL